MVWFIVLFVVVLAIAYVFYNYSAIRRLPEGTKEMTEMAGIIRDGASTFLSRADQHLPQEELPG